MFKNTLDPTKYDKQMPSKKLFSFAIDLLVLFVLNIIFLYAATGPIIQNSNSFKTNLGKINESVTEIYNIQSEAKLSIKKSDTEIISDNELIKEYLTAHVFLSYSFGEETFKQNNITFDNVDAKATYDNDLLAYYYVNYKTEKEINISSYGEETPKLYFINQIILGGDAKDLYVLHEQELPSLKAEVAIDLYRYLKNEIKSSTYYATFSNFFVDANHAALLELHNYPAFEEQYQIYYSAYSTITNIENLAGILTFVILFILVFVLPPILFGDGLTLGRLITETRATYNKNVILGQLISDVSYLLITFVAGSASIVIGFGYAVFSMPIGGWLYMSILALISFILLVVDFFFMTFSRSKNSLIETVSMTSLVDINKKHYEEAVENETH